ncbi:FtsB family cell division protein [Nocardiopsis ansamitocini]|uniref:Septum formation initiator n=1 Tax=Nocardiopsis ansamitocini TaxID=1670832 RepID=A0A9W6UHM4_9ACTN|nr:septum formation initiator family protein [Nocardiopsis ansamitocini]GLU46877.1 hypothetical protein Nans01_12280 [Nocardiopsis ansamitocini]
MPKVPEPPKGSRPRKTGPSASGASGRTAPTAHGAAKPKPAASAKPAATTAKAKAAPAGKPAPAARAEDPAERPTRTRPALTSRAAILGLLVCVIALSLAYPLREYIAQRSEIAQLKDQKARTEQAVQELTERQAELQDPAYIEREARSRLHYQYPGEQAYVVLDGNDPATDVPEDSAPSDPWFTQLWKSVVAADVLPSDSEEIPEAQAPPRAP